MKNKRKISNKKINNLAFKGAMFRQSLADAGLWETYQLMDPVLHKLGYEAAAKSQRDLKRKSSEKDI